MKKTSLLQMLALIAAVLLSACSSDNNGNSNNYVPSAQTATVLAYFPVTNLDQGSMIQTYTLDNGTRYKMGSPNFLIKNMMSNINDTNTKVYVMAGAGNVIHDETANSDAVYYPVKDFTKNYQYKITRDNIETLNQDTAKVSCYTGDNPVDSSAADINSCEDMGDVEVISDFFVKGIKENQTDKYVAVFYMHGGGDVIGMGYDDYMETINAEKFGKVFERVREKLGNPDFKFDTIIMISCLMGNAVFMHTVKDYADYYIGSESNQATEAWDLSSYMQEIGKGYDSLRAGNAILSSYKALIEKAKLSSDINIIDLSKIEALSNAFDNMSKAMEENYNKSKTDKAKTVNNFFLSAYNALNYENGQVDIYTFADRIGRTNDYYTDDYTAVKNELQAAVKNAVISNVTSEGMYQDGKGISFETMSYYIDSNPDAMDNISFAPEYISFVKQISYDIISYRYSSALDITASYNNGLEYTVKTPVAIGSAQLDIGAFDADTPENNRVGTLADIIIPEQQYDEASGLFTYKFNFGDPAKSLMFTLNGNPVRVRPISGYKTNDNISYYKTTETYGYIGENVTPCAMIIKYDNTTGYAEINYIIKDEMLYSPDILQTFDKLVIEPYSEPVVQAKEAGDTSGEDEYIPDYEIPIDRTVEAGGVKAYALKYSIDDYIEPQYRLSFTTVDTLGVGAPSTSSWQTLSEIQGTAQQ